MYTKLLKCLPKPTIYAPSTRNFWDDEHISKNVLKAHLNPELESASRNIKFIDQSVNWIAKIAPPSSYPVLLDLGCGPGLYAERFHHLGYSVMGIDFSKRSIEYAKKQSRMNDNRIAYFYQNYLTIDYSDTFDIITLIYCDYGTFSKEDRRTLLSKIYKALKPNGKLILDVFTATYYQDKTEYHNWEYCDNGGFWSENPYLCLNSFYRYDENNSVVDQTIILNESSLDCYNIWYDYFTKDGLLRETQNAGFHQCIMYNDIAGKKYSVDGNTLCVVLTK